MNNKHRGERTSSNNQPYRDNNRNNVSAPTLFPKPNMQNGSSRATWRIVIGTLIGLIVGFVAGALIFRGVTSVTDTTDTDNIDGDGNEASGSVVVTPQTGGDADPSGRVILPESGATSADVVLVKDQPAGESVFLSRVGLSVPGWVAIQEDSDGEPGNILGAQRFDAGVYQGTVKLLRQTEVGERYHATLWRDNGDKLFNFETDTLLTSAETMMFEVY
ncbi:hypothetical protein L0Y40_02235 [Candidatus Wolfebacteria bacterium]|nr:hypothetical protein [Candidatus Wolfebacteria bacterium]